MLVLTRKLQEQIRIGDNVTITVLRVKGQAVRIGIEAPRELRVVRGELPPPGAQQPIEAEGAAPAAVAPAAKIADGEGGEKPISAGDEMPPLTSLRRLPQRRMMNRHGAPPLRIIRTHALAESATT